MTDKLFKGKLFLAPTWRVQCVTEEKPWRQDLQATGHIVSAAREREVNTDTKLNFFFFIQSGFSTREMALWHQGGVLPISFNLI